MNDRTILFNTAQRALRNALEDLRILDGLDAGNGAAWQDVAGTAAVNLRTVATYLDQAREGRHSIMLDYRAAMDTDA